jgi:L-ascorbate metabolism protein UlaG (beta-lactamase superfamily)
MDGRKRTISNIEIYGVDSFHDEDKGAKRGSNIMYKFKVDGIKFCHLGDLGHDIDDEITEKIGEVDILFVPIGGTFTVDDKSAWKVINKIKPKIIVPMHYKIGGLSLPIAGLDPFLSQTKKKVMHVGNEIEIEKEDLPSETEIWTFTL